MSAEDSKPMRRDYREKLDGSAVFVSDITLPGMVAASLVRSSQPHARIVSIDTTAALAIDGVISIVTGADLQIPDPRWGVAIKDRPLLAMEKVRYVGEPVAMVAASDERTAQQAARAVVVAYEPLPFVTGALEALEPDAPLVHDDIEPLKDYYFKGGAQPVESSNIFQRYHYAHGDMEAGFSQADRIFEDSFDFPMVFHAAMEPHCVVADWDGTDFTIWSCGQSPTAVQKVLAGIFAVPLARIRVISPFVGGGFGGKASVKIDPLAALMAFIIRRPVRLCLSMDETMLTCRRLGATVTTKIGVRADGTITAKKVRIVMNGGAYADTGPAVAIKAANRAIGPYKIANLELESLAVYTNTVPGAAFRSIGGPQAVWATESQMDIAADALGLEPGEMRARNLLGRGESVRPDLRPIDVDMSEALGLANQTIAALQADRGDRLHTGMGVGISDPGIMAVSSVIVRVKTDGSVLVLSNSVEIGQGVREVLCRLAAEALAQPLESVSVATPDTALAPFDWGTGASRSSLMMGLAIDAAATDIAAQFADLLEASGAPRPQTLEFAEGGMVADGVFISFVEAIHAAHGIDSGEIIGIGRITPASRNGALRMQPLFWETAASACAVSVDTQTGAINVRDYVSVADVGKVLNRLSAEGQDEGAAMHGLGHTLGEELIYENGRLANGTYFDYRVPSILDTPERFRTILIESGDGPGPGGARGMGEGAILPIAPAIGNALAQGLGIRIRTLPLTPERVWRALAEKADAAGDPRP